MRLLDLCCGAGGAAMGYANLGVFTEIVGVDWHPQPRYPFRFEWANALTYPLEGFDFIHLSAPCQGFSKSQSMQGQGWRYQDLITPMRERLNESGIPWVMENVPQAPMRVDMMLCGSALGRPRLRRHRIFEFWKPLPIPMIAGCRHGRVTVSIYGHGGGNGEAYNGLRTWKKVMEMPWCKYRGEVAEAIPPYYTEEVGRTMISVANWPQGMLK